MKHVEKRVSALLASLTKIRDSTFRDAASLRGIADQAISSDKAGDFRNQPKERKVDE